jgi:hypothetical protein
MLPTKKYGIEKSDNFEGKNELQLKNLFHCFLSPALFVRNPPTG